MAKPTQLSGGQRPGCRAVTHFVENPEPGAKLGPVYGRRRQGKTFLLDALLRLARAARGTDCDDVGRVPVPAMPITETTTSMSSRLSH